MTRPGIKYYQMYRKAKFFDEIQDNMADIIRGANVPRKILIEKIGSAEKTYYRKLKEGKYTAQDVIKYMRAIIEIKSEENLISNNQ